MKNSSIGWTESTWNPVSGCTEVSPGCDHCYARMIAERFRGPAYPNGFEITLRPHKLQDPLKWKEPRRIFVNSMSDLFHKDIPLDYVKQIFDVMWVANQHTFQVLTKRPERAREFMREYGFMPENVWLGVSVEDQRRTHRVSVLRDTLAMCRFVSFEPLLEPVEVDLTGINWVIIGGESGLGARRRENFWFRSLIRQAKAAGAAVFVKQMGSVYGRDEKKPDGTRDTKGEHPGNWPEDLRIQEYPNSRECFDCANPWAARTIQGLPWCGCGSLTPGDRIVCRCGRDLEKLPCPHCGFKGGH